MKSLNFLLYIRKDLERHAAKICGLTLDSHAEPSAHNLVMEEQVSLEISYLR